MKQIFPHPWLATKKDEEEDEARASHMESWPPLSLSTHPSLSCLQSPTHPKPQTLRFNLRENRVRQRTKPFCEREKTAEEGEEREQAHLQLERGSGGEAHTEAQEEVRFVD